MAHGSTVHGPTARESIDAAKELDAILSVFAALGYPREVVTQWSLPSSDVEDLLRLAAESRARRVLEVGSFVGTSAFLMARALPDAEIHSVDPNLPLDVEFTAMGSADRGADLARRTLEIARDSAQRLGLDARVHFHEGGFAVGATFALSDVAIPVIGPELCAREGPFDFAFIDGLHFEDAVEADIALALAHMTPDGVVALHDAIGYWGSHVRRAVHRILEGDPSLCFTHAPYLDLYRGIGTLARKGRATPPLEARAGAAFGDLGALTEHLARLLRTTFPRARFEPHDALAQAIAAKIGAGAGDGPRVVVDFDAVDAIAPAEQETALARLLEGADAAVLGFSPPGEDGAAPAWARPLASRVAALDRLGFDAHDLVYPFLEPYTHPYGGPTALTRRTSALLDTVVAVRRGSGTLGARTASVRAEALTEASARALTDMRLQLLYGVRCFADMRAARDATDAAFAELSADHARQSALHASRAELLAHWTSWRVHIGRFHFWKRPTVGC